MEFAVIDIETTGGKPKDSKIIEIAIVIHDGVNVIDTYETLINPERKIDWFVTKLTGIRNEDVANSPKFFEVAKTVFKLLENRIFVAHNIGFDYPIVRGEFKSLGLSIRLPHLCTIQTSRVLIPGLESYGLKKLSESLEIKLDNHHRAMADTKATVEILKILFAKDKNNLESFIKQDVNPKLLNEKLDLNQFDDLPNKTGIYFFYNELDEIIYIGKSIHIKKRVEQHLKNDKTEKAIKMRSSIFKIKYQLTGSELISLLKESELIKKHQPPYNKAQRKTIFSFGLFTYIDNSGYINLRLKKASATEHPIHTFTSMASAKSQLEDWVLEYNLCQKLSGLYESSTGCFNYSIKECLGACVQKESPADYNERANDLINKLNFNQKSFLILDKGITKTDFGFVCIIDGIYKGYGNMPKYLLKKDNENYKKFLKKQESNRDFKSIINMQLNNNVDLGQIDLTHERIEG